MMIDETIDPFSNDVVWNTEENSRESEGLSVVFADVHYCNIRYGLFAMEVAFDEGYVAISSRVENPICWDPEAPPTGTLVTYETVVRNLEGIYCASIKSNSRNPKATIDWSLLRVNWKVQPLPTVDVPGR
jgi:hypothetical protein